MVKTSVALAWKGVGAYQEVWDSCFSGVTPSVPTRETKTCPSKPLLVFPVLVDICEQ